MRTLFILCLCAEMAGAQSFEVASVRRIAVTPPTPQASGDAGPPPAGPTAAIRPSPGGLVIDRANLQSCLAWAYRVHPSQIAGPNWISDNLYVISARTGSPAEADQIRLMLAKLLEDRFRLVVRRETKESRVTALVIAAGGHKLKPSDAGTTSERQFTPIPGGGLKLIARNTELVVLEQILSLSTWPRVVNRTGLSGGFDFTYERPPFDPANREGWLSDIRASLRRQLGLTLTAQSAPTEIVIIERGNPDPLEN